MATAVPPAAQAPEPAATASAESEQIGQNIAAVHDFYTREEHKRSASQRHAESIGGFVGRPVFLVVILLFVSVWIGVNLALTAWGWASFDEAPFFWLQGVVALAALLTTTVDLIEELRRDLPNAKDRHDAGAVVMQNAMSAESVLAALDEEVISPDGSTSISTAAPTAPTGPGAG